MWWFIKDKYTPNVCIIGADVLNDFEIPFLGKSGSIRIYFVTLILIFHSLVDVQKFLRYLYTFRVQTRLYRNNFSS